MKTENWNRDRPDVVTGRDLTSSVISGRGVVPFFLLSLFKKSTYSFVDERLRVPLNDICYLSIKVFV